MKHLWEGSALADTSEGEYFRFLGFKILIRNKFILH